MFSGFVRPVILLVLACFIAGCSPMQPLAVVTATPGTRTTQPTANPTSVATTTLPPATAVATAVSSSTPLQATATTASTATRAATATIVPTATRQTTPTSAATATRQATPTSAATATRAATTTPEPLNRTLYSTYMLNAGKVPNIFGDKGDVLVYTGERMPQGCQMFKVLGLEYTRLGKPMSAPAESVSDNDHGWSVTKQNDDPRDYGVSIHWWYNGGSFVSLRINYVIRQPWNVNCLVAGKMQANQ